LLYFQKLIENKKFKSLYKNLNKLLWLRIKQNENQNWELFLEVSDLSSFGNV